MVLRPLKPIGKVKKLSKWVPHELTTNQKIILKCHLLLILCNNEPFLHQIVTFDKKWIVYNTCRWPTQLLDQKKLQSTSQSQTQHQKEKGHGHWWSAAGLIHYSFLNPGKTITSEKYAQQIDETHQKPQLPAAGIGQQHRFNSSPQQHPNTCRTTKASKVEQIGLWSFCLICHIHLTSYQLITTSSRTTLQGKHSQSQQEAENAFQEFVESRSMDFYATGTTNLFLIGKNVLMVIVPNLINKDVFEPSYNDLKLPITLKLQLHLHPPNSSSKINLIVLASVNAYYITYKVYLLHYL